MLRKGRVIGSLIVFFQLAGAVALLLFALRLVRDGMTEAFGVRLRMVLGLGTRTGPRAFVSGLLATIGLQSSTATALMAASFVERDLIRARMAQIVLLGANVGTALTAWIVSTGVAAFAPLLVLAGYVLGRRKVRLWSGVGDGLIGVGLILLSVTLLENATLPLRTAPEVAAFLPTLNAAWPVALLFAAVLAILCSSSLAAVVLIMSLSLPPALTVVLVLGANLGGAVPPVIATTGMGTAARRVTIGNLVIRSIGCVVALPFASVAATALEALPLDASDLAVEAHLAFNIALALIIWPFTGMISTALRRMLPEDGPSVEQGPRWLDDDALATPTVALAGASREVLDVGDTVEQMLRRTRTAFHDNDATPLEDVAALEDRVDRRQQEIKTYLSRLGREASEEDRRHSFNMIDYVINLEHVGDVIDKGLVPAVRKKASLGLWLSDAGYTEIDTMFIRTLEILRMAQTVFMTRDADLARRLIEEKDDIRRLERESAQRHLVRLREDQPEARETSSLHLDMLRDLKRINAHLASVAHPILDEEGLLFDSRLRAR